MIQFLILKILLGLIFLKLFSIFLINSNKVLFLLNESKRNFPLINKYLTFSGIVKLNNEDFDVILINSIESILMLK